MRGAQRAGPWGGEVFVPLRPDQRPTVSRLRTRELSHLHAVSRLTWTSGPLAAQGAPRGPDGARRVDYAALPLRTRKSTQR